MMWMAFIYNIGLFIREVSRCREGKTLVSSVVLDIPFGECCMARSPKVIDVTFMQISKVMHNFMQNSA